MASQIKNLGGLRDSFQGAREYQQIEGLQSQVETLQAEIAALKSQELNTSQQSQLELQIEQLTAQLAERSGVHQILVSKIDRDEAQPRTVFPSTLIQERAESLRSKGQLTPIIVIPTGERYKLFEGELRWRGAQKLAWEELDAVFLTSAESLNSTEIFERQVVTSIQSQRLHDLDIAEAIIKLIIDRYPNWVERETDISKTLHAALRQMEREGTNPDFNALKIADPHTQQSWLDNLGNRDEEKQIFRVILGLQLHPASVSKHILPLLKIADDVKVAIREYGIEGSKAKLIDRLNTQSLEKSAEDTLQIRADAIQQITQNKLSLIETKVLVDDIINTHTSSSTTPVGKASSSLRNATQTENRIFQVTGKVNKLLADINTAEELTNLERALKEIQKALKIKRSELQ
jgi:ParB family transcriptional regulator, chromosome partitioning protein